MAFFSFDLIGHSLYLKENMYFSEIYHRHHVITGGL